MKNSAPLVAIGTKVAIFLTSALIASSSFASQITLSDPGFEDPSQGPGGYSYYGGQTIDGWTYTGRTGIAANGSAFGVSQASGNQAAFIQSDGSTISQSFDFTGGRFTLDFLAEYRMWYGGNTVYVTVDNQQLTFGGNTAFAPATGWTFTNYESDAIELSAGNHVLTFTGTSPYDFTTFIDDVSITAVPEPGSLALLAIGALSVASLNRRRKS